MFRVGGILRATGVLAASVTLKPLTGQAAGRSNVDTPRNREGLLHCLLAQRQVFLTGPITDDQARNVVAQLMYLEMVNPGEPITLYISSGGGLVYPGLAIYDVMQFITSPIHTMCLGHAESMAAILLSAGARGHRTSLPNSRLMIHQPSLGVSRATSQDVMIQARQGEATKRKLVAVLARHTNKLPSDVETAIERNNYLTPEQAIEFGLIDKVVSHASQVPAQERTKVPASTQATTTAAE